MYIHWTHYYLPKVFGYLSFICNPVFIYLILSETTTTAMGNYRYLLMFFAVFDMTYSAVELMVPMAFHVTKGGVVVYVSEGLFFDDQEYGELALIIRTTFVGLSYGILIIHFIYRYIVLHSPDLIEKIFKPFGVFCIFLFFATHAVVWFMICNWTIYSDPEIKNHIYKEFLEIFNVDARRLSLLIAMYYDVSPAMIRRSWCGVIGLSIFSIYAVSTYFILGYKIMKKLKENTGEHQLSVRATNLHNKLFKALAVQTFIPICISFTPCLIAWYTPVIGINIGAWNNYFGVIALSAFPTLDPIAIILLLPSYRNRIIGFFITCYRQVSRRTKYSPNVQNSAQNNRSAATWVTTASHC